MSYHQNPNSDKKQIEKVAKSMLDELFGENVILTTQFEFLSIEGKLSLDPEYYYTERFKFFDFWYNPRHDWLPQLATAIADYYHALTGIAGDKIKTSEHLLAACKKTFKHSPEVQETD